MKDIGIGTWNGRLGFNRYIVECKWKDIGIGTWNGRLDLIDT